MLCTDDAELANKIRQLRFHGLGVDAYDRETQGRAPQAEVLTPGYKYNLPDMNAVLGLGPVDWLGKGRYFGVILLQALSLYPILYLNITAALANIDHAMDEAAENMGCTGFTKLRRITLPLIMPGLFAGSTIIFIWSFTELGVPLIFDYGRVTSVQIFDGIKDLGGNPFPYALVVVMLGATTLLYLGGKTAKAHGENGQHVQGY